VTKAELIERMRHEEDNFTERKPQSVKPAEIRKTVVAFANTVPEGRTAVLFIGLNDDGSVQGVDDTDGRQKAVREQCELCFPPIVYTAEVIEQDGKKVVAVVVPASKDRPHFSGPAYVRRGSESVNASREMFNELVDARNSKVARILSMKGGSITVRRIRKMDKITLREDGECRVESCDAFNVRLRYLASGRWETLPTSVLVPSYDEEKHRQMLVVQNES